jgi:hypothetical protein
VDLHAGPEAVKVGRDTVNDYSQRFPPAEPMPCSVSMSTPRRRATYEDLMKVPEHMVAEIIDGELIVSRLSGRAVRSCQRPRSA